MNLEGELHIAAHQKELDLPTRDLCRRAAELISELVSAGRIVLAGLNARIDVAPPTAKPVFNGIADLREAISHAEKE